MFKIGDKIIVMDSLHTTITKIIGDKIYFIDKQDGKEYYEIETAIELKTMSKDLFFLMREQEIQTSNFLPTKKEIQKNANAFIDNLINKNEMLAQAKRLGEALNIINEKLIESLPKENFTEFGVTGTFRNGGDSKNFKDDPIYCDLLQKVKERENLLLTALKSNSEIYDDQGILVPKISKTPRKDTMAISF